METEPDPRVTRLVVAFLRSYANMTQTQFGQAAGVDQGDVSRYEQGRKIPAEEILRRMAAAAGLPWFLVAHLRRFCSALVSAADGCSAIETGNKPLAGGLVEPALLAICTYRLEDAAAPGHQNPEPVLREAEAVWMGLQRLPSHRRKRAIELSLRDPRTLLLQVCEASIRAAADRPEQALELAKLALFIAERVEGEERRRRRLMGYAWAHIGNAHRVGNKLAEANEAFARAWDLWGTGTPSDPELLPEWRLLDLEASLRREERHFPQALELLDRALAASRSDQVAVGRILLNKEFLFEQMGDTAGSITALEEATPYVEASGDPRLLFALRFKTANSLSHLERYAEAAALLPKVRELAEQQADELSLIRVAWLEARIAAGQGRTEEATAGLNQARRDFADHDLPYDAALASLDLAVLWLEAGGTAQVRELAAEMQAIFQANGIHREALAALRIFCDAAQQETATAELARRVAGYLCRARHDPELRFVAWARSREPAGGRHS